MIGCVFNVGIVELYLYNLRDFVIDCYCKVDDEFYGGGVGMVFKFELVFVVMEVIFCSFCSWVLLMLL